MSATSPIPGFSAPAAGFEAPLEMLAACHGRIGQQCETLRRLVAHLAAQGSGALPDEQARSAAANVMRYFDTAAPQHHADEDEDLFPALLEAMAGSDAVCIRDLTERLAGEHEALELAWERLRVKLAVIAAGGAGPLTQADVERFIGLYASHIEMEEHELLPMAARLLSDAQLDEIGRAMRARRGVGL